MKRFVPLLFFILLFTACVDDQDFDQADDLTVIPSVSSSLIYFETDEATANTGATGLFFQSDFSFEAFNEEFVADNVLEATITYELENTTSKELRLRFEFLDTQDNVLDIEDFTLDPEPTALLERQVVYGDTGRNLDILRNTVKIRLILENLGDNESISSQPEPKFIVRTSADVRLKLL